VLNNAGPITFTLNVAETIGGQSYQSQSQRVVTVGVLPPSVTCFDGSISKIAGKLQLTLKWAAYNAAYCTLTVEPDTEFTHCGNREWPLASPQGTYTLTAVGSYGATAVSYLALSWALAGGWSSPSQASTVPNDMVLSPDGSRLYVANLQELSVLTPTADDNSPLQQTKTIAIDQANLQYASVAVSADGSRLYAATLDPSRPPVSEIRCL
jgi:DNA-binding beta-propeller fold protein YncE